MSAADPSTLSHLIDGLPAIITSAATLVTAVGTISVRRRRKKPPPKDQG